MTRFTDDLDFLITGKRKVQTDQVDGPQDCTVIAVDSVAHTVYVTLTNSVFGTDRRFGPLRYGRTSNHPEVSDLGLVEFIGQGVDRGWLVSWTPA